jgi:hypothetical protein
LNPYLESLLPDRAAGNYEEFPGMALAEPLGRAAERARVLTRLRIVYLTHYLMLRSFFRLWAGTFAVTSRFAIRFCLLTTDTSDCY